MGYLKGGAFLIQETEAKDIFIRSEFEEDQKMMFWWGSSAAGEIF